MKIDALEADKLKFSRVHFFLNLCHMLFHLQNIISYDFVFKLKRKKDVNDFDLKKSLYNLCTQFLLEVQTSLMRRSVSHVVM